MSLKSLNKVCLLGIVGKDPQGGQTQNGKVWCSFSVATSEGYKDKNTNEWVEQTEWHQVKTFNERIVNLVRENVKKGSKIYVEGQNQTRKWTDANGVDKYTTEVVIPMFGGELVLLDKKEQAQQAQAAAPAAAKSTNPQHSAELADEIKW